ncbi:MAG: hypothetical protein OHK005_00610 [Candidatus Methylacidiphilales bacterium]
MPARSAAMRGISRIDSGNTHGWFVRAYRSGTTHSKFFSDLKHGGKAKALSLAQAYRDQLQAKLGPPAPRSYRLMRVNRNNTTGIIGVSRTRRIGPDGTVRDYFTVSWRPEPNQPRNRSFSIQSLGEKKAFALARKFRREMEREIRAKAKALQSRLRSKQASHRT